MSDSAMLRQRSLLGRLMLDYDTTEELGWVDSLLVDVAQAQVVGLIGKGGMLQRQRPVYSWDQITSIGTDSLMLQGRGTERPPGAAQPMVGLEVWTDTGNCVGQIVDYRLERQGQVVEYLFSQPHQPGLYGLAPDAIISAGRKRMMVAAQAVEQAQYFEDEDNALGQDDWKTTAQAAQSLAEQMQQRAQGLSDYAQERWLTEDLNQQLQSTSQQVRDQLQDRTKGLRSQLNPFVSKAKKRLGPLNRALENTLENTLDKINDQTTRPTQQSTIDLESFEVWDDEEES